MFLKKIIKRYRMAYSNESLKAFIDPISDFEDMKAQHSISMVQSAIDDYNWAAVGLKKPIVKLKGSYWNDTNVKLDSDVDIYVLFHDSYTVNRQSLQISAFHRGNTGHSNSEYKEHVWNALKNKFGNDVIAGNISFKIKGNTYKHVTDVVCAFRAIDESGNDNYTGICLFDKKGNIIINYPEQDTKQGNLKNFYTDNYYKKLIRILKGIRNDNNWETPSFLIESLVSNADNAFICDSSVGYRGKVLGVINHIQPFLFLAPNSFYEVNNIKPLFHEKQKWNINTAKEFIANVKEVI